MQQDYWLERWQQNQVGFHREVFNGHLLRFWPMLQPAPGSRVFVPLCGKSRDLIWLRDQGYDVVGVELSALAVQAFFAEHGLQAETCPSGKFSVYEAERIRIFCGDFFDLTADILAGVEAIYDRAALIALPPEMRKNYVGHLRKALHAEAEILLVAFEYPQQEMQGPPFSVAEDEVRTLFEDWCSVKLLHSEDILASEPRFRERGVSRMQEQIYAIKVK